MIEVRVNSVEETYALARTIAQVLRTPALLTLSGDLGAGKTTFTKGLAHALHFTQTINSPTFTILKSYEEQGMVLHHIDAYRLEGMHQDLGFEEIFEEDALCVVEWFHFIEDSLPKERINIEITHHEEARCFSIDGCGENFVRVSEVLQ